MAGVITVTIKNINNDEIMQSAYQVLSIDIVKEVNRIPYAQIVLLDGDAAARTFEISDSTFFQPGELIQIQLDYEGDPSQGDTVFKGVITQHQIQVNSSSSLLILELKDVAFKLTLQRKNQTFSKQKDSSIIQNIITQVDGITVDTIKPSRPKHQTMVQFACTDWDFILSRAEANGHWVLLEDGHIKIAPPNFNAAPKRSFEYGISEIYEFEMDADIRHQYGVVQGIAWDETNKEMYPSPKQAKAIAVQGNLSPQVLAEKIGANQYDLVTSSALDEAETQAWADAQMIKSHLSLLRGRLKVPGLADIHLGDMIDLNDFGSRFRGKTPVTGIRHQVNVQGWITDIQFGLPATWLSQKRDISEVPAAGLLPAVNGLQIGIVETYVKDPDEDRFRVRVRLPTFPDNAEGLIWARLAALDAGPNRGTFFRPEPGDEVVLGFLNDDPRQAVILGSLHSATNKPPLEITDKNNQRGILSKENLKIIFDDQDRSVRIETPGGNRMTLIDEGNAIYITDGNNNQFTMNSKGIQINSEGDIAITAKGNITLKGKKVDVI